MFLSAKDSVLFYEPTPYNILFDYGYEYAADAGSVDDRNAHEKIKV